MNALAIALTVAFAAGVETAEAAAVVLAVGVTRSWKPAMWGSACAVVVLVAFAAIFGTTPARFAPVRIVELLAGAITLLLGLGWLRKAVQRWAGRRALGDAAKRFERTEAKLRANDRDSAAFAVAFGAVLLEGLEVAIIVVTFGVSGIGLPRAALAAASGIAIVTVVAFALRVPLSRVPENALRSVVAIVLTTFGTYWSIEGIGIDWPIGAFAIPALALWYVVLSIAGVYALRGLRLSGRYSNVAPIAAAVALGGAYLLERTDWGTGGACFAAGAAGAGLLFSLFEATRPIRS